MKNLLLLLLCILTYTTTAQVSSISSDSNNVEISSFYNEKGNVRVTLSDTYLNLFIDLDGGGEYNSLKLNYKLLTTPVLLYNEHSEVYNILFDLESKQNDNIPIGGLIDYSTNSIMLFYEDGSSLLYVGEGITIII